MHPVPKQPDADEIETVEIDAEELERLAQERIDRLNALSQSLREKRKDAIDARLSLGIDEQWRDDIEFYEGIDDANRHEMLGSGAFTSKPPGQILAGGAGDQNTLQSTVFINITRPYCDAAAARCGDMLMPTDDRSFSIQPTPVPELEGMAKGEFSVSMRRAVERGAVNPEQAKKKLLEAMEQARVVMEEAKDRAKLAQTRIDDWLVECQYHAEVRRMIEDCAKIGTGVLKGPTPTRKKITKVSRGPNGFSLAINEEIRPESRCIDPRNLFPDGSCGDNIHNGSYIWERDRISRKQLMELRGAPGYIDSEITECLKEGPQLAAHPLPDDERKRDPHNKDSFEIWYYHGIVAAEDFELLGCECEEDSQEYLHVVLTMVNDRVIKGALNPLDTGDYPYDVMCWQQVSGRWAGIGVSRQIRTPQRIVNSSGRNMMDNAGLTSGPQILIKLGAVVPADGNYTLHPRKVWYVAEDADIRDIKEAMGVFNIDARQQELMEIINFGLKLAEDVTGLPLLLQGQQGAAPDTLGGMQMLNNNASTVMRRIAKGFDDYITEPHIRRYYVWLMQYGDEAEKGDCTIDARGSSALVERDLQNQAVLQMGPIVTNPVFGVNPKKWFAEYCKSQRLDNRAFQYTDEEQKQIDEQASQGPSDPRIAVAQLRGQIDERLEKIRAQAKTQILQLEQQFEADQNERDRQLEAWLAQLEQQGTKSITLDQIKAKLGDTSMKLRTQRDLSAMPGKGPQVANPPSEPAGRAVTGRAYPE